MCGRRDALGTSIDVRGTFRGILRGRRDLRGRRVAFDACIDVRGSLATNGDGFGVAGWQHVVLLLFAMFSEVLGS